MGRGVHWVKEDKWRSQNTFHTIVGQSGDFFLVLFILIDGVDSSYLVFPFLG